MEKKKGHGIKGFITIFEGLFDIETGGEESGRREKEARIKIVLLPSTLTTIG